MKLFRVYYSEMLEYEDYVEALTEEQAKQIFANTLEQDDGSLEPLGMSVMEFTAEETDVRASDVHLPIGLL